MPEPGTRSYFIVDDREAGSVSVLIEPGYRLSEAALGEIVLTAATRWAEADKLTVAMPDTDVFTLAGIAPQCIVSLNTDVRDILDRPGSLMA